MTRYNERHTQKKMFDVDIIQKKQTKYNLLIIIDILSLPRHKINQKFKYELY